MPRKVRIASFGLNENNYRGQRQDEMIPLICDKIDSIGKTAPDLIVLPEAFLKTGGDAANPNWEALTQRMLDELSVRAARIGTYIAAPVYEPVPEYPELKYNTVMLLDRNGQICFRYRKVHTVISESRVNHVLPGRDYPVYDADFGRIGFQTCFDIGWREGWKILADKGVEMVIWTAAYDGGNLLETYAAYHMYYVVSSVRTNHARIIDITGRTVAESARWDSAALATVDLETTLFHIDDQYHLIDRIRSELGDKVNIKAFSEENVFTIESNDEEWPVARISDMYGLKSYKQYHADSETEQARWRNEYPVK